MRRDEENRRILVVRLRIFTPEIPPPSSMKDITSPSLIKLKGILFLLVGLAAAALLLIEHPSLKTAVLFAIAVWCFCRFYYFAFYVIEHYVDSRYRFSGLWSFGRYLVQRRKHEARPARTGSNDSTEGRADEHGGPDIRNR